MRYPRSFREANQRRHALIRKTISEGLTQDEKREWILVDRMVGAWIEYRHREGDSTWVERQVARLNHGRDTEAHEPIKERTEER